MSAVRDRKAAQAEAGPRAEMMGQVQFISTFSMKVWKKLKEHVDPKKVLMQNRREEEEEEAVVPESPGASPSHRARRAGKRAAPESGKKAMKSSRVRRAL